MQRGTDKLKSELHFGNLVSVISLNEKVKLG